MTIPLFSSANTIDNLWFAFLAVTQAVLWMCAGIISWQSRGDLHKEISEKERPDPAVAFFAMVLATIVMFYAFSVGMRN